MTIARSRAVRAATALCAAVGLTIFTGPFSGTAIAATDSPKIMLVMDASGSMAGTTDDGSTKIAAAQASLTSMLDSIPDDVEVGLRVFGATAEPGTPDACTDSQLTAPLAAGDRSAIAAAISSYQPKGETPISYALQEAANDLGPDGQRSIILVSDGVATCAPDPCEIAGQIKASGVNLKIDVVGFDVAADANAKAQLQCVAAAGGGQYYDASTQQELSDSLGQLAAKAALPYTPTGEPVKGTTTTVGAPVITAGLWLDQIGVPESADATHFYRIERQYENSSIHINAVMTGQNGDSIKVRTSDDNLYRSDSDASTTTGVRSASMLIDPRGTGSNIDDYMGKYIDIAVERLSYGSDGPTAEALPVQIFITEEPAVASITDLPKAQKDNSDDSVTGEFVDPTTAPGFVDEPESAVGGTGVDSAQEVTSGAYQGYLAPGDLQIFKIPVEYGQFLSAQAIFPDNGEQLADQIRDGSVQTALAIYDSDFTNRSLLYVDGAGWSGSANNSEIEGQTSEVRYRNRESGPERTSYSDGYYYIAIAASTDKNNNTYLIPFTLNIGVHGTPSGAPQYADGETKAGPGMLPVAEDNTQADGQGDGPGGLNKWVWVGGAGALGVVLLGVAWLLMRRRNAATAGPQPDGFEPTSPL